MNSLIYWKAHKIDTKFHTEQAQKHWLKMMELDVEADEKIEELEEELLIKGVEK